MQWKQTQILSVCGYPFKMSLTQSLCTLHKWHIVPGIIRSNQFWIKAQESSPSTTNVHICHLDLITINFKSWWLLWPRIKNIWCNRQLIFYSVELATAAAVSKFIILHTWRYSTNWFCGVYRSVWLHTQRVCSIFSKFLQYP